MINITDVRIKKMIEEKGEFVAVADITIDNCFAIHDIDVLKSDRGVHIKMPDRRLSNGSYKNIVHPINNECRLYMQEKVAEAYKKAKQEVQKWNLK